MRNWNTGGLSLSRPKQEQQNSVWQYLISGWKSNAYLRQVTETWPSSQWTCCLMAWDADFGRRCKHRYDQTSDVKRYTEMPSNHWTWSKSSPKQQELRSPVKRLLITLLTIFLDALHILMFSHVHSLAITTRHMFFFLININPGASNLAELVKWSPDTTQKQRY